MGDPEFRNDENVLVRTPGVYVKSIPFEGILTNKRVILVDRAKNLLPPKEIPLSTIKEVESGENAIRDQILTFSVLAKSGEIRQMILTFSRREGGNRIKERDEWARLIRQNLLSPPETGIRKLIPGTDASDRRTERATSPKIAIINAPPPAGDQSIPAPVRRETESRPSPRISPESGSVTPATPAPAFREPDASTIGQYVFCSRCGNRVTADSAFCNRCGSPIVVPGQYHTTPARPVSPPPISSPPPSPVDPAIQTVSPVPVSAQPQRPIDREIQSVEPIIERSSSVKIPSDPLRTEPEVPVEQPPAPAVGNLSPEPVVESMPPQPPASPPGGKPPRKGLIPRLFSPKARTHELTVPESQPSATVPPVQEKRRIKGFLPGKKTLLAIGGVIVILLLVAAGAVFIYPMLTSGNGLPVSEKSATVAPTPTLSDTVSPSSVQSSGTIVVPVETAVAQIPVSGVYVHVNYLGGFKGTYGAPDALVSIPGNSGDRVWEVENAVSTVQANFEKLDGSSHELLVEILKDGTVLTRGSTTTGHGSVKLSVDASTGIAENPVTS